MINEHDKTRGKVMTSVESDFKGHPVISLKKEGNMYAFTFGVEKAKLILENIESIKAFVEKNGTKAN